MNTQLNIMNSILMIYRHLHKQYTIQRDKTKKTKNSKRKI